MMEDEESRPPMEEESRPPSVYEENITTNKERTTKDQNGTATDDPAQSHPNHPALLPAFFQNLTLTPATKVPKDALKAVYNAGKYKAGLTLDVLCVQSMMAGIYIAMAGQLFLSAGGGVLGAALFPTGLLAVILTSAELFTGDALIFVASVLGGQVSPRSLLRNWTVSWLCNFAGSLAWAYFMTYLSDALEGVDQKDFAVKVALKKAYQPWGVIVLKGIGANFMVCLGVWQATCAEEVAGKALALWFPITGFVVMGLDHCIANQFLIPMGMLLGADISITRLLFQALLPATLGNLLGGGVFIGAVYWYVFDSMDTANLFRERIHQGWKKPLPTTTPSSSFHGEPSSILRRTSRRILSRSAKKKRGTPQPSSMDAE